MARMGDLRVDPPTFRVEVSPRAGVRRVLAFSTNQLEQLERGEPVTWRSAVDEDLVPDELAAAAPDDDGRLGELVAVVRAHGR